MPEIEVPRRVERKLVELLELFETDQPDGLIADEIITSSALVDWTIPGSEFGKAMAEAEKSFGEPSFWTSPPPQLRRVIDRMRSQVARGKTRQDALQGLRDTFVLLNSEKTG